MLRPSTHDFLVDFDISPLEHAPSANIDPIWSAINGMPTMRPPWERPCLADLYVLPALGLENPKRGANLQIAEALQKAFYWSPQARFVDFGFAHGFEQKEGRKYKGDAEDSLNFRSFWQRVEIVLELMKDRVQAILELSERERAIYAPRVGFVGQSMGANAAGVAQALFFEDLRAEHGEESASVLMPRVMFLNPGVPPWHYQDNIQDDSRHFPYARGKKWTFELGASLVEKVHIPNLERVRRLFRRIELQPYRFAAQSIGDGLFQASGGTLVREFQAFDHRRGSRRAGTLLKMTPLVLNPGFEHLMLPDNPRQPGPNELERIRQRFVQVTRIFADEMFHRTLVNAGPFYQSKKPWRMGVGMPTRVSGVFSSNF